MWLVNVIYWLHLFIGPIIITGLIIFFAGPSKNVIVIMLGFGALVGISLAEYVRRKIGLSEFFSGLYRSGKINEAGKNKDQSGDKP
jgi:hypothetical protein